MRVVAMLAIAAAAAGSTEAPKTLVLDVGLVRVSSLRPGTQKPWDPPSEKAQSTNGNCDVLADAADLVMDLSPFHVPGSTTAVKVGRGACHFLTGVAAKGQVTSKTDPDPFVRVVASPEVSYRSPTIVDALSHVFHFRVAVPVGAIPNSGLELYVQNDSGRGTAESQEVIGSLRLRRKQLLDAFEGSGLLRLDDKEGGLERIEIAVSEDDSKGVKARGTLNVSKASVARIPGLDINAGDVVEVSAVGRYELEGSPMGADGLAPNRLNFTDAALRGAPHGAALAVVGEYGRFASFLTKSCRRFVAPSGGILAVGINDQRPTSKAASGGVTRGSVSFQIDVRPPTPEEWRTGVVSGRCEAPPQTAVALADRIDQAPSSPTRSEVLSDGDGPDVAPAAGAPPEAAVWSGPVIAAVQRLAQSRSSNIAIAVQRILHPSGNGAVLRNFDYVPDPNKLIFRFATSWRGAFGTRYVTTVAWEIGPDGHHRAAVLSDTARIPIGRRNLQELNRYFATNLYPMVAQDIERTY